MAAIALPAAWGFAAALEWLGIIAVGITGAAVIAKMVESSRVSAKMKQYAKDNADTIENDLKVQTVATMFVQKLLTQIRKRNFVQKKEPREPTPFTHPHLFQTETMSNKKVFIKIGVGEVWVEDTKHWSHFEVYTNKSSFEKGKRIRAVWLDGRLKPI
jgi:hypothetical protein